MAPIASSARVAADRLAAEVHLLLSRSSSSLSPRSASSSFSSSSSSSLSSLPAFSVSSSAASAWHAVRTFVRRQSQVFVPANYPNANAGPLPGTVVGIVLGSIAGFLLFMWLLYTCFNIGRSPARSSVEDIGVEALQRSTHTRTHTHTHTSRRSRSRSRPRSEREVIEIRSPPRRRERERVRETTVIREERRRSRAPPTDDEEDIVEVIEEHSPSPRPRRHSSRRVSSGFRNVDPDEFAGGDSPLRKVRH